MTNDIKIDVVIPEKAKDDVMKFNETINQKYLGRCIDELTKVELNYEVREFEETLKAKYPYDKDIKFKLQGSLAYHRTLWGIKDILEHYRQEYPERYVDDKKQYSIIEVNNMLFGLKVADVIGEYEQIADCYGSPLNKEAFTGTVTVLSRYE